MTELFWISVTIGELRHNKTLTVTRELDIEKEELTDVVRKVERVMRTLQYQSIPPLVYQLVLATQSKLPGVALKAVIAYFDVQENNVAANISKPDNSSSQRMDDISSADSVEENSGNKLFLYNMFYYLLFNYF